MRKIYAIAIGAGLGAGSVFLHASLAPFGLILFYSQLWWAFGVLVGCGAGEL